MGSDLTNSITNYLDAYEEEFNPNINYAYRIYNDPFEKLRKEVEEEPKKEESKKIINPEDRKRFIDF